MVLGLRAPARRVPPLPARHTSTRGSGVKRQEPGGQSATELRRRPGSAAAESRGPPPPLRAPRPSLFGPRERGWAALCRPHPRSHNATPLRAVVRWGETSPTPGPCPRGPRSGAAARVPHIRAILGYWTSGKATPRRRSDRGEDPRRHPRPLLAPCPWARPRSLVVAVRSASASPRRSRAPSCDLRPCPRPPRRRSASPPRLVVSSAAPATTASLGPVICAGARSPRGLVAPPRTAGKRAVSVFFTAFLSRSVLLP